MDSSAEIKVDVRGRACPVPVLELARAIRAARVNDTVVVQADDPAAERDIVAWCETTGHRLLDLERLGTELHARVKKSPAGP